MKNSYCDHRNFDYVNQARESSVQDSINQSVFNIFNTELKAINVPLFIQVANIFRYLIVERKEDLKDSFKDIYFIPEYPQFDDIKAVYEEVLQSKKNCELREEINEVIKCVSHESAEVRYHAVSRLKTLLHDNQVHLQKVLSFTIEVQ